MEKQRQQVMLPLDKIIWLSKQQRAKGDKSISATINRILSEYQYLIEKIEEQREKEAVESYKDVRTSQIRQQLGQPINDQTTNKVVVRKNKK
jgi:hypothetical protein